MRLTQRYPAIAKSTVDSTAGHRRDFIPLLVERNVLSSTRLQFPD